jgi:hypothetical protein
MCITSSGGFIKMETDNPIVAKWNEIKTALESVEPDLAKSARGVAAAGVRARKGLRIVRDKLTELVKLSVEFDKKDAAQPATDNG